MLLKKLPISPLDKTGWPWTKESKAFPPTMPDGKPWPRITIVTPSYNQGQFLEETIRSVLLQNYPNLEYIVMDGGSTDDSADIIRKYEPWLSHWVSKKDDGQADAIQKGFERSTGDILAWLNSDDYLLENALKKVSIHFKKNLQCNCLIGAGIVVDSKGNLLRKYYSFPQNFESLLVGGQFFMQMSSFWLRTAYEAVGGLDTSLRFCFDYELFLKLARRQNPVGMDAPVSAFRLHESSKTSTIWEEVALPEIESIKQRHGVSKYSETTQQKLRDNVIREFYQITRVGILKDLIRDPGYSFSCIANKLRGKPGSPLVG